MRLLYIATTFPKLSETFIEREVRGLLAAGLALEVVTLFGGGDPRFPVRIHPFSLKQKIALIWNFPRNLWAKPEACLEILKQLLFHSHRSTLTNWAEQWLAAAWIFSLPPQYLRKNYTWIHGCWFSAPVAAASMGSLLSGLPASGSAHAYDLFEKSGDSLFDWKKNRIQFITTSTEIAKANILSRKVPPGKVTLIRRSLPAVPWERSLLPDPSEEEPWSFMTVGRMVQKKNYPFLIQVLRELHQLGVHFHASLVGDGPLYDEIKAMLSLHLPADLWDMPGAMDYPRVEDRLLRSHAFLFCGQPAPNGDQDGLPNVIAEAMAWRVPVFSSVVGGTSEALGDSERGFLIQEMDPLHWAKIIQEALLQGSLREERSLRAYEWVSHNFDPKKNAQKFISLLGGEKTGIQASGDQ